jgi:hypothetical protein
MFLFLKKYWGLILRALGLQAMPKALFAHYIQNTVSIFAWADLDHDPILSFP